MTREGKILQTFYDPIKDQMSEMLLNSPKVDPFDVFIVNVWSKYVFLV